MMSIVRKTYMSENESDRLKRIIEAARQQLKTAGVDGLTMRNLAAASRVSTVTLYNRFGNKDNIVSLVLIDNFEKLVDQRRPAVSTMTSPLDNFLNLITVAGGTIKSESELAKALVTMYFKPSNDRELPNHLLGLLRDRITPILEDMRKKKLIAAKANTGLISHDIADRFLGVALKWFQQEFKEKELFDRIGFSVLLPLAGYSTGAQSKKVHSLLDQIVSRISAKGS